LECRSDSSSVGHYSTFKISLRLRHNQTLTRWLRHHYYVISVYFRHTRETSTATPETSFLPQSGLLKVWQTTTNVSFTVIMITQHTKQDSQAKIYHPFYVISGYHSNELSSNNTLQERSGRSTKWTQSHRTNNNNNRGT
jgi:hypothetical protein